MKKAVTETAAAVSAVGMIFGLSGCAGSRLGACDKEHWDQTAAISIQSGPNPADRSGYGYGQSWQSDGEMFIDEMPGSPATDDKPLRLYVTNGALPVTKDSSVFPPSKFSAQVELFNPDTDKAEKVIAGPEVFDMASALQEKILYAVGDSALKLTGEFDPGSDGFFNGLGASAPSADFTLTCVAAPK